MPTDTRVVYVEPDKTLHIEAVTLPDPGPGQVVVELIASGICHSPIDGGVRHHHTPHSRPTFAAPTPSQSPSYVSSVWQPARRLCLNCGITGYVCNPTAAPLSR